MIRLNTDYLIDVDDMNYTLVKDNHKTYTDKNGIERKSFTNISYYSSLENALKGARKYFINKSLQEYEMTLGEAIKRILEVNKQFDEMIKDINP